MSKNLEKVRKMLTTEEMKELMIMEFAMSFGARDKLDKIYEILLSGEKYTTKQLLEIIESSEDE